MQTNLTSSNSFSVKVLDEFYSVMFIAQVSYNKESAFRNLVKPFITNVVKCAWGQGNAGEHLEYNQTIDGICIDWKLFNKIMSEGY